MVESPPHQIQAMSQEGGSLDPMRVRYRCLAEALQRWCTESGHQFGRGARPCPPECGAPRYWWLIQAPLATDLTTHIGLKGLTCATATPRSGFTG